MLVVWDNAGGLAGIAQGSTIDNDGPQDHNSLGEGLSEGMPRLVEALLRICLSIFSTSPEHTETFLHEGPAETILPEP